MKQVRQRQLQSSSSSPPLHASRKWKKTHIHVCCCVMRALMLKRGNQRRNEMLFWKANPQSFIITTTTVFIVMVFSLYCTQRICLGGLFVRNYYKIALRLPKNMNVGLLWWNSKYGALSMLLWWFFLCSSQLHILQNNPSLL